MELTQLKVRITKNLKKDFMITCTQNETSMTSVVGELIQKYLSENKKVA